MKRWIGYLVGMVLIISIGPFWAQGSPAAGSENPDPVAVGREANGKTIRLKVGQAVELTLDAKPGTGYGWQWSNEPPNGEVLKFITRYEQPVSNLLGAATKEHWFFYAVGPGATVINLRYARSGEAVPLQKYTLKIVVRAK